MRALLAAILLLTLTGCVAVGVLDHTASTIDHSVGTARNNSILLNIMRASRHEPLYFYSVSRVSGAGIADLKISFPAFTVGPNRTVGQKNFTFGLNGLNALDTQESGSFDIAVLESKNFYEGMLQPLTLEEVGVLLGQGFPRELVYRIAVESATVYGDLGDGKPPSLHRYLNDPSSQSHGAFNLLFAGAMSRGITVESFQLPTPPPAGAKSDDAPHVKTLSRLCVDPALIEDPSAMTDVDATGNRCGQRELPTTAAAPAPSELKTAYEVCVKEDEVRKAQKTPTSAAPSAVSAANRACAHLGGHVIALQLNTRSLFGIYSYLGALMRNEGNEPLMNLGAGVEPRTSGLLLDIRRDAVTAKCFARAKLGQAYCIPEDGAQNLKIVFSLLNSLQALKTSPGDLPITPAVRIEQ